MEAKPLSRGAVPFSAARRLIPFDDLRKRLHYSPSLVWDRSEAVARQRHPPLPHTREAAMNVKLSATIQRAPAVLSAVLLFTFFCTMRADDAVLGQLKQFKGGTDFEDDVTLVIVKLLFQQA